MGFSSFSVHGGPPGEVHLYKPSPSYVRGRNARRKKREGALTSKPSFFMMFLGGVCIGVGTFAFFRMLGFFRCWFRNFFFFWPGLFYLPENNEEKKKILRVCVYAPSPRLHWESPLGAHSASSAAHFVVSSRGRGLKKKYYYCNESKKTRTKL